MIIERNIFYLKFGKAKDALAAMKEMVKDFSPAAGGNVRMLTDVSGDSYRLVLEFSFSDFTEMEKKEKQMDVTKWRETYQKFIPHCERAYREYLKVVE